MRTLGQDLLTSDAQAQFRSILAAPHAHACGLEFKQERVVRALYAREDAGFETVEWKRCREAVVETQSFARREGKRWGHSE